MSTGKPIRIAYPVLGDSMGGAYFSMLELTENLPDGYERLILLHERGVFADYLDAQGIPYEVLDHIRNFRSDGRRRWGLKLRTLFSLILPLARYLKENRIDIVHTQTVAMHKTWAAAAWFAGVPHIWHQRTGGRPKGIERRLTSQVICVSEFVRRDMADAFGGTPVAVVVNPFDVCRYTSTDRQAARASLLTEIGAPLVAKIIGFIANIHPRKRPKLFVEAAARAQEHSATPLAFVMFGADRDGYSSSVQTLASELDVDLKMLGFRTPAENNVAALDVYVGCSVDEGFGRAPVEAGLVGTPMVLSNSGNHPSMIEHDETGLLVTADDPQALADAIVATTEDPGAADERARACRAVFESRYDQSSHVGSLCRIYAELL